MKIINSELVQAAIRKSTQGATVSIVASIDGDSPVSHVLIFQDKDAETIAKALEGVGVKWKQIECRKPDFYEPRII